MRCYDLSGIGATGKYSLDIKLFNKSGNEADSGFHEMPPSRLACGMAGTTIEKRKFLIKCLEEDANGNKIPVGGCKVRASLSSAGYNGGHDEASHLPSNDRWGILGISEDSFSVIPEEGLEVYYEAPEVSGEALVTFEAKDPSDVLLKGKPETVFQVKHSVNFVKLENMELMFVRDSHEDNGGFVTPSMRTKLLRAVANFRAEVIQTYGEQFNVPTLRTEAASLDWGGLYDINKNWSSLLPLDDNGHCGHRYGNQVDLSMSVFNAYTLEQRILMRKILDKEIRGATLYYPIDRESPTGIKHWHVQEKQ